MKLLKLTLLITLFTFLTIQSTFAITMEELSRILQDGSLAEFKEAFGETSGLDESAPSQLLLLASRSYQPDKASFLINSANADVNFSFENGITPIMLACIGGGPKLVKLLLEHGADVNATDEDGSTVLIYAAFYDNSSILGTLLESGADVNMKSGLERTAIHLFSREGNLEAVKKLVSNGADYATEDIFGNTPYSMCRGATCKFFKNLIHGNKQEDNDEK